MPIPAIAFQTSSGASIGVEWEFGFVDHTTRNLVNCADPIITEIHESLPELKPHVHKEFLLNTVEFVTGICRRASEAVDQLQDFVSQVDSILAQRKVHLFGAGTHPFAKWNSAQLTQNPRYEEMINRTQWWGRQMLIWGVHVHVGITQVDRVMNIISSLLTYYPQLLALSASSPIWESIPTGYASNRAMIFQQLPTAGLPFHFNRWSEFEEFVYDQTTVGIIDHINEIRWDIRPVPRLGTIEIRVSDSLSSFAELAAIVALSHCLVVWIDQQIAAGVHLDQLKPWQVQENKWRAARYGLDAIIITHSDNTEMQLQEHLRQTIAILTPTAISLGCLTELEQVMHIYETGASYMRQNQVLLQNRSNYVAVVDSIVTELHSEL